MIPSVSAQLRSRLGVAAIALLALLGSTGRALAVSTRDLVELTRAGLSDDVLVALVEADETVYALDATQIIELRRAGISERVILAMIHNGRRTAAADPAPADAYDPALTAMPVAPPPPEPAPVVVQPETQVIVVPYVPVFGGQHPRPSPRPHARPAAEPYRGFGRFMNDGWVDGRPPSGAR